MDNLSCLTVSITTDSGHVLEIYTVATVLCLWNNNELLPLVCTNYVEIFQLIQPVAFLHYVLPELVRHGGLVTMIMILTTTNIQENGLMPCLYNI